MFYSGLLLVVFCSVFTYHDVCISAMPFLWYDRVQFLKLSKNQYFPLSSSYGGCLVRFLRLTGVKGPH